MSFPRKTRITWRNAKASWRAWAESWGIWRFRSLSLIHICQAISALLGSLREPPPLTKGATGYLAELAAKEAGGKPFSYLITDGKDRYPQELIHRCRRGVFVRSKTELLIADSLYREGARFHYEKRPDLPGLKFLPDFTIYRRSGDVIYWEHCGLIDQPRYCLLYTS